MTETTSENSCATTGEAKAPHGCRWVETVAPTLLAVMFSLSLSSCTHRDPVQPLSLDTFSNEQLRVFLKGYPGDWRHETDQSRGIKPPESVKPYPVGAELVELGNPLSPSSGTMSVADAIAKRRSRRSYSDEEISNQDLGFLLWSAQGVAEVIRDSDGKPTYSRRTAPSAGGRYPIETYVSVNRVADVPQGLYRYIATKHALLPIRVSSDIGTELKAACYNQAYIGNAAVTFIWTAIPYRMEWRYAYLAHRMIAMEVGHIGQTLYLAGESSGLGVCTVLGYDQARMDSLLGIDGQNEFTMYMATVGKPATR